MDPPRIDRETIYYLSHSGGKDSQAMYALPLAPILPASTNWLSFTPTWGRWSGAGSRIIFAPPSNTNCTSYRAAKTLFDMVRTAPRETPGCAFLAFQRNPAMHQSDLKRGPIEKFIRNDMKARGVNRAVNVMGLRAEESPARRKRDPWRLNARLSVAGRTVHDWLPIHDWSTARVFQQIAAVGQEPFWVYAEGNRRLSCVFCIMGCDGDLRNGRKHRPGLYEQYLALEAETCYTLFPRASLAERAEPNPQQALL